MSQPESNSEPSDSTGRKWTAIILALVAGMAVSYFIANRDPKETVDVAEDGSGDNRLLELTRTAMAATENLAIEEADVAWQSLLESLPDDPSVLLNRALNRVLRVDRLWAEAIDGSSDESMEKAARSQLPAAINAAQQAIDDYQNLSGDQVTSLGLRSRIELHQADLLPGSKAGSLQEQIFGRLVAAISGEVGKSKRSVILAGPLANVLGELEDPAKGIPDDLRSQAVEAFATLSEQQPDNLFLAIQTARLAIANQDPRSQEWVSRTQTLSQAIEPSLDQTLNAIGSTPAERVVRINQAIDQGNWTEADKLMQFWFNVLHSTEIVKSDRRRVSPHPLDQLNFDSLRRLSTRAVESNRTDKL